jgi:hypothetical protein
MPEQNPCGRALSANPLWCMCLWPVAGTIGDPDVAAALQLRGRPDTGLEMVVSQPAFGAFSAGFATGALGC